jgi:hypothetical protein
MENSPDKGTLATIEFPTVSGVNHITWRIAHINQGDHAVLPAETRLLGVQFLDGKFSSLAPFPGDRKN